MSLTAELIQHSDGPDTGMTMGW